MNMPLRIGVIGAGHLGRFHARLIGELSDVHLVGVCDPIEAAAIQLAGECGTRAFFDYRELIPQIDAAIVATPTATHHRVGCDLLAAGAHVLMEKPLARTKAEADEMVALAERHGKVFQVGHIERFNPALDSVRAFLNEPKYIEAARYTPYTFRSTDIGVVLDLMVHDLDLAMTLAGSAVEGVLAIGTSIMGGHEDVAQARIQFANGCVANLSASRVSYRALRQMQVWSRESHASIDFATRTAVVAQPSAVLMERRFDGETLSAAEKGHLKDHLFEELIPLKRFEANAVNALLEEQRDFVAAIREGREPRVSGRQGRDSVAVAEQILAAIANNEWNRDRAPAGEEPAILRGPHWHHATEPAVEQKRSA
jgi:predicted dehydrogenase